MKIGKVSLPFKKIICLALYYGFAQYLPESKYRIFGGKKIRYQLAKRIFLKCGKNVNIERRANFGCGRLIEIGDSSGIGIRSKIPSNTKIGNNVMMGPNCTILPRNHRFDNIDIPMIAQGFTSEGNVQTIIEDDVWIGLNVTMTPGRTIRQGSIIGACCLLCKDFPAYSIVGGNPSTFIKSRLRNFRQS